MKFNPVRRILAAAAFVLTTSVAFAPAAPAQVTSLYYKEVAKDGRIYVFNSGQKYAMWQASSDMGVAITLLNYGPNGETVVAENETAMELYSMKHDKDGYVRPPAPKPAAPAIPTSLKVGDGELKFGLLLQSWYVTDDSERSTGSSQLGNTTGINSFRIRRAEIKLNGKITPSWGFEVMLDPAKGQFANQTVVTGGTTTATVAVGAADSKLLQDLAVTFLGLKGHEFSIGQKKIFLTEEGIRSSSELDFAERSLITRQISDRRELGLFWKGDWSEFVTTWFSATQGTVANTFDDSNDTLNFNARVDIKPIHGLNVGVSGGTSGGEGASHLGRERFGFHARYTGAADLPLVVEAEYYKAKDESIAGTVRSDLKRNGWYGQALYTFGGLYQIGGRYEEYNRNEDSTASNKMKIFTGAFQYMVKGKNINLKLNYEAIKDDGRKVNNVLDESYTQFVLAAQVAF